MLLFHTDGKLTADNDKTNIIHNFDVPDGIKRLIIKYTYSPKALDDREKAEELIKNCFEKYDEVMSGSAADYLPVKNLITLSVDENGQYRGAAHRQDDIQEHIISEDFASAGFTKGRLHSGIWDIVLNVHSISCDVNYSITIEGEA